MHKEMIKYYDPVIKRWLECEADTFDSVVHLNKGIKHILKDIDMLLDEDGKYQNKRKEG